MLGSQSIPPIAFGIALSLVCGGICAVLMTLLRKRRHRVSAAFQTTAVAREEMIHAEAVIDKKMDELNEAHEQSLRGQTFTGTDVLEQLSKAQKPKPTLIDANVEELKRITSSAPKNAEAKG